MKFTTAIALTALLGNAAFSNALDVCNRDTNDEPDYGGVCNKVCERPQTGIRNQVSNFNAMSLKVDDITVSLCSSFSLLPPEVVSSFYPS